MFCKKRTRLFSSNVKNHAHNVVSYVVLYNKPKSIKMLYALAFCVNVGWVNATWLNLAKNLGPTTEKQRKQNFSGQRYFWNWGSEKSLLRCKFTPGPFKQPYECKSAPSRRQTWPSRRARAWPRAFLWCLPATTPTFCRWPGFADRRVTSPTSSFTAPTAKSKLTDSSFRPPAASWRRSWLSTSPTMTGPSFFFPTSQLRVSTFSLTSFTRWAAQATLAKLDKAFNLPYHNIVNRAEP